MRLPSRVFGAAAFAAALGALSTDALAQEASPPSAEPAHVAAEPPETAPELQVAAEPSETVAEPQADAEPSEAVPGPQVAVEPSETGDEAQAAPEPTPRAAAVVAKGKPAPQSGASWDGNFEAGIGSALLTPDHLSGFGRVRGGVTYVDERDLGAPMFYSLGVFYELSDLSPATLGVQAEMMSLVSGVWGQIGVGVDTQPRRVFLAALGFSILGLEAQARSDDPRGDYFALYAKLRLPLSVMVYGAR